MVSIILNQCLLKVKVERKYPTEIINEVAIARSCLFPPQLEFNQALINGTIAPYALVM